MSGCDCSLLCVPIFDCIKCILCFFTIERAKYYDNLENELRKLRNCMERLEAREQHVMRKINRGKALKGRVEDEEKWVEQVSRFQDDTATKVEQAEEELRKKHIRWFFPRNCFSYTKVGDEISSALERATQLMEEYNFQTEPSNPANEIYMPQKVVGFELKFEEIWRRIEDPAVEISGLYGRGGVGKTTLLQMIYDRLLKRSVYGRGGVGRTTLQEMIYDRLLKRSNMVIWVEMRKGDPVGVIQEAIRQNFAISEEDWKNKTGTDKDTIRTLLRKEKFYLLLDDVNANHLGSNFLEEAGVPLDGNNNGSKVIFSTWSEVVCNKMRAVPIKVDAMTHEDAIELLKFNLGPGALEARPEIGIYATEVAKLCYGLPLLLTRVGGAMAGVTDTSQWIKAIRTLRTDLSKFEHMNTKVLNVLKFGYDTLHDDFSKECCLYFSMLPEVKRIQVEELVEQWIGGGFLGESDDNIHVARDKGAKIIGDLKLIGLLEGGESSDFVKMHDEIHKMALWLASRRRKILVQHEDFDFAEWTDVEWILLFGPKVKITADVPHRCHNLTTLLVKSTNLETIPSGFFQSVPSLKLLDLSNNYSLAYLPIDIGELGNLQYLNLSGTLIQGFPASEQKWNKSLRIFIVSAHFIITREMISDLRLLRVIRMLSSMYDDEISILQELEKLEHINEIGIELWSSTSVQKLLDSPKLGRCIKVLVVTMQSGQQSSHIKLSPSKMVHLQRLELSGFDLNGVEIECEYDIEVDYLEQLRFVSISNCKIENVNWLIHARHLQTLSLRKCPFMEEIVSSSFAEQMLGNAFGQHVFGCLTDLKLRDLPKLKFICSRALKFLSLNRLLVDCCRELCRLPFNSASAENIKEIKGERLWWDSLLWDDNQIKEIFFLKYRCIQESLSLRISDGPKAMGIAEIIGSAFECCGTND